MRKLPDPSVSVQGFLAVSSVQSSLGSLKIRSAMMLLLISCAVDVFVWRHFICPLDKDDSEQRKLVAAAFSMEASIHRFSTQKKLSDALYTAAFPHTPSSVK